MGEQRPAVVADEAEDDLLYWPPTKVAVHLQCADELAAKSPDVVAVSAQGLARQLQGQQVAQERLEAFHQPQTGRNIARLHTPSYAATDQGPDSRSARDRQQPVAPVGCCV